MAKFMEQNPLALKGSREQKKHVLALLGLVEKPPCPSTRIFSENTLQLNKAYKLGGGSFGVVYRVVHSTYGDVAVKKFLIDEDVEIDDVWRELKYLVKLQNANVVSLFGACFINSPFIVMELCEGTLHGFIHLLEPREKLNIFTQVVKGLSFMHGQGFIHNDLKTTNILIKKNFVAALGDFGACRRLKGSLYYQSDVHLGTFAYSNLQALKYMRYSKETDLWSMGIILYELFLDKHFVNCSSDEASPYIRTLSQPGFVNERVGKFEKMFPDLRGALPNLLTKRPRSADKLLLTRWLQPYACSQVASVDLSDRVHRNRYPPKKNHEDILDILKVDETTEAFASFYYDCRSDTEVPSEAPAETSHMVPDSIPLLKKRSRRKADYMSPLLVDLSSKKANCCKDNVQGAAQNGETTLPESVKNLAAIKTDASTSPIKIHDSIQRGDNQLILCKRCMLFCSISVRTFWRHHDNCNHETTKPNKD